MKLREKSEQQQQQDSELIADDDDGASGDSSPWRVEGNTPVKAGGDGGNATLPQDHSLSHQL